MPAAARVGDFTTHGGTIVGPGEATVRFGGSSAAVVGDTHVCPIPPPAHAPTASPFTSGSATVRIGGSSQTRRVP